MAEARRDVPAAAGAGFSLVDDPALMALAPSGGAVEPVVGGQVELDAVTDEAPLLLPITQFGRARRPLSPAHLGLHRVGDGAELRWVRRSRRAFDWPDDVEAPDDETVERYRLTLSAGAHSETLDVDAPRLTFSAADLSAWRARGSLLDCSVARIGAMAASSAIRRVFALD